MARIERLSGCYARQRAELAERLQALEEEITQAKRRRMRGIKGALARTQDAQDTLRRAIAAHPELFRRPKTLTVHGVRVGLMKAKGKIAWEDPAQVVRLIRKHLPEQVETLIQVRENPARGALAQLSAAELKRIGCTVADTGEQPLIKPQDGEVDKLVDRLLAGDNGEWEEQAS